MPRESVYDQDTTGLRVQVNWGHPEEPSDPTTVPAHVQISTHDDQTDSWLAELIGEAGKIIGGLLAPGSPETELEMEQRFEKWREQSEKFRPQLAAYVTLHPDTLKHLVRTLHRASNQAWPISYAPGKLDGVRIPDGSARALAEHPNAPMPAPGATGYQLAPEPE